MNLYFCFSYARYYPAGGMSDCDLITEDLDKAKEWLVNEDTTYGTAYIYDVEKDEEIHKEDLVENN